MGAADQRAHDTVVARVSARPPFLYLACLLLGLALDRVLPLPVTLLQSAPVRWTAGLSRGAWMPN